MSLNQFANLFVNVKILVVEDDNDLRDILTESLENCGAQIVQAASGNKACKILEKEDFDIILSDMYMPDGDGLLLARFVQKLQKSKPIFVIFSGFNDLTPEICAEAGIAEVLTKPTKIVDVIHRVAAHLKKNIL